MANIIRKDIVQISFDVNDGGLTKVNKEMNDLKKSFAGGLDSSIDKFKKNVNDINKSVKDLGKSNGIAKMKNDIETTNAALSIAKDKFNAFGKAMKGITTHPIKTLDKAVLGLQMSAGRAKLEFKNLAKSKVDNLKSKISEVKGVLTEGQTGAKGFGNAIKNIGKIGLGKTISSISSVKNGFSHLKNSIKQVAPGIQELNNKLKNVSAKLSEIGRKAMGPVFNGLKKVAGLSFKGLAIGIGAVATGLGAAVTQSVKSFADYEQLVGGVETLFKNSSGTVQTYANDAYKTAGLSANDYMETVTSFSASLLQGLKGDTEKSAQYAHTAIVDMADNANKMGTDMEMIQNAYQGFAKQNYTMLDNLKLGYGGTKTEMERLVKDASNMKDVQKELGVTVDGTSLSFDNIVNAIHVVQANMDIMGTTAKEAEGTIQGSLFAMKSAWGNLLTAIGSGENLDQCFDNMISSVEVFGNNLIPVAERALSGLGTVIEKLTPKLSEKFPELAQKLIPPLIKATTTMVSGLIKALPNIIGTILKEIPGMAKQLGQAISELFNGLSQNGNGSGAFSSIFGGMKEVITDIINVLGNLTKKLGEFFTSKTTLDAIKRTWDLIKGAIQAVSTVATPLINFVADNLSWIAPMIMGIVSAFMILKGALTVVTVAIGAYNLVVAIMEAKQMLATGATIAETAAQWGLNAALLASPITWIVLAIVALIAIIVVCIVYWDKIKEVAVNCWNSIKNAWGKACDWFNNTIIQPIANFFGNLWNTIKNSAQVAWNGIKNVFVGLWNWMKDNAKSIVLFIINPFAGIFNYLYEHCEKFRNFVDSVVQSVLGVLKGIGTFIYTYMIQPIINVFKSLGTAILVVVLGIVGLICQGFIKIATWINENVIQPCISTFTRLWISLKSGFMLIWTTLCLVWGKITAWVNTNIITPLINGFKYLWNSLKIGIQTVWNFLCAAWGKITGWVNANIVQPVVSAFKYLWNSLKSGVQFVWTTICTIWGNISNWVNSNVIQPIKNFFQSLWSGIKTIASGIKDAIVSAFQIAWQKVTSVWGGLKDFFKGIWNGLKDTGGALKNTLVGIWKDAVTAISKPVNKLIGGANWVLEKLGSEKRVAEWKPYANGTDGHPGGNALVNDGKGAELVRMPNGNMFIPQGRNVLLPNAPKGMQVLSAEHTAQMMGKKTPTFKYANGIGEIYDNAKDFVGKAIDKVKDFDIWNFFDNAKGLVNKVIEKFVSFKDMNGYVLDAGKAMISNAKGAMSDWVTKMFDKFGGKDIGSYVASKGVEQWRSTVIQALKMTGQYSEANVKRTLYQMQTESGGNPRAINLWDSNAKKGIPSKGLMQCIDPTFKAYAMPGFNKNIYDPLSNILASIRYAVSRYGSLAKAYQGHGYANGGLVTKAGLIGERDRKEMVIPLSQSKRNRGLNLWNEAGDMLGVTPRTPESNPTSYSNTKYEDNSVYSPQFNLTISGTNEDRVMERKVKRWINDAMQEVFESMSRKNPRTLEV